MSLPGTAPRRNLVWLIVIVAHAGVIAAMLLSSPPWSRELASPAASLAMRLLPNTSARIGTPRISVQIDSAISHPRILAAPTLPPVSIDNNAITLSPSEQQQQLIDWERESALAVQSSTASAAKEKHYRDLSGLTPEQLDWVRKNRMEPMPGFQWDHNSRREMLRHGIIKLNDYCVLIVVVPFCRFGAKIQYNGDLFKHMRDPDPVDP